MAHRIIFKYVTMSKSVFLLQKLKISQIYYYKSCNFQTLFNHIRYFSGVPYNSDTESDFEEEEIDVDVQMLHKSDIRNILYSESTDPLIEKLNECASVQDVFNIIKENQNVMKPAHISQAVLVLWDLQKIFYKHNKQYYEEPNSTKNNTLLSTNSILQNYVNQVNSHEDFELLVKLLEKYYKDFTMDALTCSMMYLNRMGVKLDTNLMRLMMMHCENSINKSEKNLFPLTSLSRFLVTVYSQGNSSSLADNAWPIVLYRLEHCETEEDFKLITICLHKMKHFVSAENVDTYKRISNKLILDKIITKENPRTIIKALKFLSQPQWCDSSTEYNNIFMHLLKGCISQLSSRELLSIFKIFQVQKEPADMLDEIQNHALKLVSDMEEQSDNSVDLILELLSCIASFSSPLQKSMFEKIFQQYINKNLTISTMPAFYKIIYHVKSSDKQVYDRFWNKSLELTIGMDNKSEDKFRNILILCSKYMQFCKDVSTGYRCYNLEKIVSEYLINKFHFNNTQKMLFSRITSFIIAFSDDNYVDDLISQAIKMMDSFKPIDFLNMAKGLQFALENGKSNKQLQILDTNLHKHTMKLFKNTDSVVDRNILLRSCVYRKDVLEDGLFQEMLNSCMKNPNKVNTHMIKNMCFYMLINNYLNTEIIEMITEYIIKSNYNILATTVERILYLCYSLGHTPKRAEEFFDVSAKIIMRDKQRLTGLTFLQACLSLCYYHALPNELIKQIFSVEFMEQLDDELSNCYAKTVYPARVRDYLMQLNRAACLDYPESNVPWFHQKYVDDFKKKLPRKDFFLKQVQETLFDLTKDTNTVVTENIFSPYGYRIDFELSFNEKPITEDLERTILILQKSKAFSNNIVNLKGYYQLKQRHLEMLGYNIISINFHEWKLFYTRQSCIDYIKNKIWPLEIQENNSVVKSR